MLHDENLYHLWGLFLRKLLLIIYDTQYETRSQIRNEK